MSQSMRIGLKVALISMLLFGCTKSAVKKEFESLINDSFTASGSALKLTLCGWPAPVKLRPVSVDIELSAGSDRKGGGGIAELSTKGDLFDCKAKISFMYARTYVGGHGYSGGTEIQLNGFKKLDAVDPGISDPPSAQPIKIGEIAKGVLDKKSRRMPDGTLANYYFIDLEHANPLIRFNMAANGSPQPKGYIYQNNKLIDEFRCRWSGTQPYDNVCPLEKGKAVILITASVRTASGSYTIRLDEPDDAARSMLRLPDRYKKKIP